MCGFLKGVLTELRETGIDGIEAITPPPLGDTPIGLAREQLGPDVTLIGGLDPTQFVGATPDRTRKLIHEVLAQIVVANRRWRRPESLGDRLILRLPGTNAGPP